MTRRWKVTLDFGYFVEGVERGKEIPLFPRTATSLFLTLRLLSERLWRRGRPESVTRGLPPVHSQGFAVRAPVDYFVGLRSIGEQTALRRALDALHPEVRELVNSPAWAAYGSYRHEKVGPLGWHRFTTVVTEGLPDPPETPPPIYYSEIGSPTEWELPRPGLHPVSRLTATEAMRAEEDLKRALREANAEIPEILGWTP